MKTCCRLLLLTLALCLLLMSSHAIRLPRDPNPVRSQVNNDEKIARSIRGVKAWKDSEDCSSTSSGNYRKLMTSSPSTTSSKSLDKESINVEKSEIIPPARSDDKEYGDITEMDYSPAKRKPPIHN